ncbi:TPA: hypothetical protein RQJ71_001389 [Vibrio vulnificus]|nr:hypothetical protein [Vibrio vulnificus]
MRYKQAVLFIPSREKATLWERGHSRILALGCHKLCGSKKIEDAVWLS